MRLDEEGQVMEASGHLLLVRSRGLEFRSNRANGDCTDFMLDFLCVKGREISLRTVRIVHHQPYTISYRAYFI